MDYFEFRQQIGIDDHQLENAIKTLKRKVGQAIGKQQMENKVFHVVTQMYNIQHEVAPSR